MRTQICTPKLRLQIDEKGILSIVRISDGLTFTQEEHHYAVSAISADDHSLCFDFTTPQGVALHACATLPAEDTVELTLSGQEPDSEQLLPISGHILFPSPWRPTIGDTAILPVGEGAAVPVDDGSFQPYFNEDGSAAYHVLPIAFTAILRQDACLATSLINPYDAMLWLQRNQGGLINATFACLSSKGHLGYPRTVRFTLTDSLGAATRKYRSWRDSQPGWIVTLREKQRRNPNVEKLIGAADIWLWDDNNMNRLYGRPESPEVTPRTPIAAADYMLQHGMTQVLWNAFEGETKEDCSALKERGFLVGKYDIYCDVLPKPIADQVIPYRKKRSVNTKYWPDIVRINADGTHAKAWQIHGKDGKLYDQHGVCDMCSLRLTMENVPPDVAKVGYTARLIDVQAGIVLGECYSPSHPATREDSLRYINAQNRFLADIGLVVGVEVGQEGTARDFHYSEGLMSPVFFRADDAGRKMCNIYKDDEIPPQITRYMLNPFYRVPLWELIYHDCTVSYWYWGDSSNSCPQLMPRRDLFNALYGVPPLYSLNMTQWEELKEEIVQSYHRATPVARLTGYSRMTDFQWLTHDRMVQKTTFDNNVTVIANFSPEEFIYDDHTVIPSNTALVQQDDKHFTIDCNRKG